MRYVNARPVKKCQYCGMPLDKDYDICPHCQNNLKPQVYNQTNQSYNQNRNESHKPSHEEDNDFVYESDNEFVYDYGGNDEKVKKSKKIGLVCAICGGLLAIALVVCIAVTSNNINEVKTLEAENRTATTTTAATQATAQPAQTTTAAPVVVSVKKPAKVKITKVTSGKQKIKVKWKKVSGATKYRVKVSTSKKGKNNVTYETVSSNNNSVVVSGLKKNTNYYVRVRAIKNKYGVKVEGDYSNYIIKKTK